MLNVVPRLFSRPKVSNFYPRTTHGVDDKSKIYSAPKRDDKHEEHTQHTHMSL